MKTLLLILSLVVATNVKAQIQIQEKREENIIGKIKSGSYLLAQLSYKMDEKDTVYTLMYSNAKYQNLVDYQYIQFNSQGGTFSTLYNLLKTFFTDEHKKDKKYEVSFKLGDQQITALNYRVMGITSIMFYTSKGYFYLTEKQLDILFGKSS